MPLELTYQPSRLRHHAVQRVLATIWRRRFTALLVLLVSLYVSAYAGLRVSRVLVHQHYLRWNSDANPGFPTGGGYVEEHDIGRGSNLDATGRPTVDPLTGAARALFFPLIRAECGYWRRSTT